MAPVTLSKLTVIQRSKPQGVDPSTGATLLGSVFIVLCLLHSFRRV